MSVYPDWTAGTRLSAENMTAGQTVLVQKVLAETVTSSTIMQDDNELYADLAANASYVIDAYIFAYQGAPASGTGAAAIDINTEWSVPDGASGWKFCLGPTQGMTDRENTSVVCSLHGFTTDRRYGLDSSSNGVMIHEHLLVNTGATAGKLQFRWAQSTSNSLGTTVGAQSHMTVTRLA